MKWNEAIARTLDEMINARGLDVTKVSKDAGYSPSYLTKLKKGIKRNISADELEPILGVLGVDLLDFLREAKKKRIPCVAN